MVNDALSRITNSLLSYSKYEGTAIPAFVSRCTFVVIAFRGHDVGEEDANVTIKS